MSLGWISYHHFWSIRLSPMPAEDITKRENGRHCHRISHRLSANKNEYIGSVGMQVALKEATAEVGSTLYKTLGVINVCEDA